MAVTLDGIANDGEQSPAEGYVCSDVESNIVRSMISFGATSVSVPEGTGAAATVVHVPITLSSPAATTLTVGYATTDVTATSPADYTAVTGGTLTIPAGATSADLALNVVADAVDEPTQSFSVQLNSPPAGWSLGTALATVKILDDDNPPSVAFAGAGAVSIAEGSGAAATAVDPRRPVGPVRFHGDRRLLGHRWDGPRRRPTSPPPPERTTARRMLETGDRRHALSGSVRGRLDGIPRTDTRSEPG